MREESFIKRYIEKNNPNTKNIFQIIKGIFKTEKRYKGIIKNTSPNIKTVYGNLFNKSLRIKYKIGKPITKAFIEKIQNCRIDVITAFM